MKLYYCGREVGYVDVSHIDKIVDDAGDLKYESNSTSSKFLMEHTINEQEDKKNGKWLQYQDIKTISFDIKDGFIYVSMYDVEIDNSHLLLAAVPKSMFGIPISSVDSIDVLCFGQPKDHQDKTQHDTDSHNTDTSEHSKHHTSK